MSSKHRDILIFFVLAFGLSCLAAQLPTIQFGVFDLTLVLCGCGPLASGLLCYWLLKTKNSIEISLMGTRPWFTAVVCIVPVATLCLTQTKNELSVMLVYSLMQLLYCFGEEFGWRHYLQNATSFMNEWLQSFVIGLLWFAWHYSFIEDLPSRMLGIDLSFPVFAPIMIVLLTLLSYLFGMMVTRSQSILFPTVGHFLFKSNQTTMIVTGCLIGVMLVLWNRIPQGPAEDGK